MGLFNKKPTMEERLQETTVKCWLMTGNAKDFLKEIQKFLETRSKEDGDEYGDQVAKIVFQLQTISTALLLKDLGESKKDRKVIAERIIEIGEEIKKL